MAEALGTWPGCNSGTSFNALKNHVLVHACRHARGGLLSPLPLDVPPSHLACMAHCGREVGALVTQVRRSGGLSDYSLLFPVERAVAAGLQPTRPDEASWVGDGFVHFGTLKWGTWVAAVVKSLHRTG